mgnify:CR=1 FL=1
MLRYASTGEDPELKGNERFIWPTIRTQIDRDIANYASKCQTNRENGKKGGRPARNQTVAVETERFLEKPGKANKNKKVNKNDKENTKDIYLFADKPPRSPILPPTVDEVQAYCLEKGYQIDPERFVSYYEANGWMIGRNKMKSWQAAVRNWAAKEKERPTKPVYESGLDRLARMYKEEFGDDKG